MARSYNSQHLPFGNKVSRRSVGRPIRNKGGEIESLQQVGGLAKRSHVWRGILWGRPVPSSVHLHADDDDSWNFRWVTYFCLSGNTTKHCNPPSHLHLRFSNDLWNDPWRVTQGASVRESSLHVDLGAGPVIDPGDTYSVNDSAGSVTDCGVVVYCVWLVLVVVCV